MQWRKLIGPTNSERARQEAPQTLRGRFGTDGTRNAAHGSDSPSSAAREIEFFFGEGSDRLQTPAQFTGTSLAIIKVHSCDDVLSVCDPCSVV